MSELSLILASPLLKNANALYNKLQVNDLLDIKMVNVGPLQT